MRPTGPMKARDPAPGRIAGRARLQPCPHRASRSALAAEAVTSAAEAVKMPPHATRLEPCPSPGRSGDVPARTHDARALATARYATLRLDILSELDRRSRRQAFAQDVSLLASSLAHATAAAAASFFARPAAFFTRRTAFSTCLGPTPGRAITSLSAFCAST